MLGDLYRRLRERAAHPDRDEAGQGMVEYALVLLLVAIIIIVILTIIGHQTANVFSNISNTMK